MCDVVSKRTFTKSRQVLKTFLSCSIATKPSSSFLAVRKTSPSNLPRSPLTVASPIPLLEPVTTATFFIITQMSDFFQYRFENLPPLNCVNILRNVNKASTDFNIYPIYQTFIDINRE